MMATAKITLGETVISDRVGPFIAVTAECSDCNYKAWTGGPPGHDWSHIIDDHLAQHEPGRALDIEVDWVPRAACSVCEDGGDIHAEDDTLICRVCGTAWDIHGAGGTRKVPR